MSYEEIPRYFTPEEYLTIERDAPYRSEYDNGRIFAMAGASEPHTEIVDNITYLIYPQLRKSGCRASTHDTKVRPKTATNYHYPDIVIRCGTPQYEDDKKDILLNPIAIFEVLSPSTESYDRVVKYNRYLEIESLRDYVLVSQSVARVEHHAKNEAGEWHTRIYTRLTDTFTLAGVAASLTLADIYDRIELVFPESLE